MFPSLQEFLVFVLIIVVLNFTGVLPIVIRMLKELRGDYTAQAYNEDKVSAPGVKEKYTDLDLCYKLLGISPGASWEEIERAYRNKAKIHHPDRGGDEDAMKALNEAYELLKKVYRISKVNRR